MKKQNRTDFCAAAMKGLNRKEARRVGIALDCAIMFGIMEYMDGNESLHMKREAMQQVYDFKLAMLERFARED